MEIPVPTAAALGTVAGLSLIVTIVTEIILRAWNPTAAIKDRFGPFLALLVALVFSVLGAITQGSDLVTATLLAVVVGGTGMGIHDVTDSAFS